MAVEAGSDGVDRGRIAEHSDLDGTDGEVGEHRIDLRADEIGRHLMGGEHTGVVLRGEHGDNGSAIDAERGKRLEIRLDAGAAARIGAGDGECDRHRHQAPRFASVASTMPRKVRAAAAGSGASDSAEITATPSAPAAMTGAALPASMPAMPQTGSFGARACSAAITRARPAVPIGALFCCFEVVT